MATDPLAGILHRLRRTACAGGEGELPDEQLLKDFVAHRSESAIAALVRRHGPMVWGVCRRVLRRYHDAEDAFQATFLVLVRRAPAIAAPELLANWLYGVAYQTARKARATAAKRTGRERPPTEGPEPVAIERETWGDLWPVLDQELSRLPDTYRSVLVLCDLEGRTRKEAARDTGLPEGTVASRLARARGMLAARLAQRGVTLSGGALVALLAKSTASARVPEAVTASTLVVTRVCAGANGTVPGAVSALADGVLKSMTTIKLKTAVALALVLGALATGATLLNHPGAAAGDERPAAVRETPPASGDRAAPPPKREKEPLTAWGPEVGGLQAGLSILPDGKRSYSYGETITLFVRVRNTSKETVRFQYIRQFLDETPPTTIGADGKEFRQAGLAVLGMHGPVNVSLKPGEEVELESRMAGGAKRAGAPGWRYELRPVGGRGRGATEEPPLFVGRGKIGFQYERVLGNSSSGGLQIAPALSKLATGKLELEVGDAPEPARLDAMLRVQADTKKGIGIRFEHPGTADQSFASDEYRYAVLDKDGVQVNGALVHLPLAIHTTHLPKTERSVTDYSDYALDPRKLKSGEEYYVVVTVRNLTALAKFKSD
ncbi:ECF RNA polymerase sigma factor SigE [Gemmata sp. SH-PL17]|uniref:RNA polymerase sigma factor n=1 Tax=Gemmata sp. SH-PL17 TaxID=1630693 RepID=UPI00078D3620|nr:sigma-70 family RNA polymerase sigma factor [Gemmata sp. SH-PL17]AMV25097.1 ECF RNA polymerase sigma factor SigE [Gemmata sp. SH-PL17]